MAYIKQVLINKNIADKPYATQILSQIKNIPFIFFDEKDYLTLKARYDNSSTLLLTELKGELLCDCPGTQCYSCCGYKILNVGANCLYNCTYCILQDYFKTKMQIVYADLTDYLPEIETRLRKNSNEFYRIGTGEFTDSLILDDITLLSSILINLFRPFKNIFLELKTKSLNINNLLNIEPSANAIIAWSLNTPQMINDIEKQTPSLEQRLNAAQKVVNHGYNVAFHFDPIILYPNCLSDYGKVIDDLFASIHPDKIKWISMGTLRFTKGLKNSFYKRSPLFIDEFIQCDDNKFRYIRHRRVEAYRYILNKIHEYTDKVFTYLCMESTVVWNEVFGYHYDNNEDFENDFNSKVFVNL